MKDVLQGHMWTEFSKGIKHTIQRRPSTNSCMFLPQWKSEVDEVLLGKLKMALGF